MAIRLSAEQEQSVRSLIRDGRFGSEGEVIDEALRLLQERDGQARLADLRSEIALGIQAADRGGLASFDPRATLDRIRSSSSPLVEGHPR